MLPNESLQGPAPIQISSQKFIFILLLTTASTDHQIPDEYMNWLIIKLCLYLRVPFFALQRDLGKYKGTSTRRDFFAGWGYHKPVTGLTSVLFILSSSQADLLLIAGEERTC